MRPSLTAQFSSPLHPSLRRKLKKWRRRRSGKEGTLPPGGAARGRREMWNIMRKFKIERDLNWENAPLHTS